MRPRRILLPILLAAALVPTVASAHVGNGSGGSFATGFLHPLTGPDHLVAMLAVGLWGAFLGAPAIWLLPIVFPLVMAVGGALGVLGVPLPHVETGIALSATALGLAVACAFRAPLWLAAVLVGGFAVFHGHAHGTELPAFADPLGFSLGFVVATGLVHLAGIALALPATHPAGRAAVRAGGAAIAVAGVFFLVG